MSSDAPYTMCCIEGCSYLAIDPHHEPERVYLKKIHKNDPRFKKDVCRYHHTQRHDYGYARFKKMYPGYDGWSLQQYREYCLANNT